MGNRLDGFFLQPGHFNDVAHFPTYVHPLAFEPYDEEVIFQRIGKYGWVKPEDTDCTSTNCLLNSFANKKHFDRYGYHPYAHEYASLVRQGIIGLDEAEQRMDSRAPDEMMSAVREKLELAGDD